MIQFINRHNELELLESEWNRSGGRFIVVHGRRRIGKTRLIKEFTKNKTGIFYVAADSNSKIQLDEFKVAVANYYNDNLLRNLDISSWKMMFEYMERIIDTKERIYIWIDEFSYLIKNDKTVVGSLQVFIDHFVREKSNLFLIISGSLFGMMSEKVLSSSSPLYGRRNRDIFLSALSFKHSLEFLPQTPFEEALKIFLFIGGIPEYLQTAEVYHKGLTFLEKEFLGRNGYFYREPYFLLSQEFKEIKTYFSILNAIAYGNIKPSEIASFVGLNAREIYPYLELLINYGFIKREMPGLGTDKKGIYLIEDAFFDTWFNFVYRNKNQLEQESFSPEVDQLNLFLGKRFEKFIRDNLIFFFRDFKDARRWWYRDIEIDIISKNIEKKELLIGECKWKTGVQAKALLKELKEKAGMVGWEKEERREIFAIFAKSFKEKIDEWEGHPVYCFDLKDIEMILMGKK
ncbi:MAG: ATP-binding protein [Candidatus Omnitrophota bacterium]